MLILGARLCQLRRVAVFGSEHIDHRKARLSGDAIPKVNGKPDIAGPKRIASAASDEVSAAILDDGGHGELAGAVEPDRVFGAAIELKEGVAVPTRAAAKVRALGQWSGYMAADHDPPYELCIVMPALVSISGDPAPL